MVRGYPVRQQNAQSWQGEDSQWYDFCSEVTVRTWLSIPLMWTLGCSPGVAIVEDDGVIDGVFDPFAADAAAAAELEMYAGAEMRIIKPQSGSLVHWGEMSDFEVKVRNGEGEFIEVDPDTVVWTTSEDETWVRKGTAFEDDELVIGFHDITAALELPTGDRVAHTAGGVVVQSEYAGTYSGLYSVDVIYQAIAVTCVGSALIEVDPYGEAGKGDGGCLVSLLGVDLPLNIIFDIENDDGVLEGTAGADIFGWFTYDFPATGALDPEGDGLQLTWAGNAFGIIDIAAKLKIPRVSLDTSL
jgi:hypothetical protein